jgi:hypothetical protein
MLRGWGRTGLWETIEGFVRRVFRRSAAQSGEGQRELGGVIKDGHLSLILRDLSTSTEKILHRYS